MKKVRATTRTARAPIAVFLMAIVIIAAGAHAYFEHLEQEEIGQRQSYLLTVAELKSEHVGAWLRDRQNGAEIFLYDHRFADQVGAWLACAGPACTQATELLARMAATRDSQGYAAVHLLDAHGVPRLTTESALPQVSERGAALTRVAQDLQRIEISDVHPPAPDVEPELDIAVPLITSNSVVAGSMLIRFDPYHSGFPRLSQSFSYSPSQEVLVVRRDGDSVVFLNELRDFNGARLNLRLPLTDESLVATQAAYGFRGVTQGHDYRGAAVVAAVSAVPNTNWAVVAKIDREEISAPMRERAIETWAAMTLLIALAGAFAAIWWRKREAMFGLREARAELERRSLVEQCDDLIKHANDGIMLLDESLHIVDANDRALEVYGYERAELIGQHVFSVRARNAVSVEALHTEFEAKNGSVYESVHKRKDGTVFPVEVSARRLQLNGHTYWQGILRDITERKASERRIDRLGRFYAALSETNQAIIRLTDEHSLFERVCAVAVEQGDLALAWVGVPRADTQEIVTVTACGSSAGLAGEVHVSVDAAVPEGNGLVGAAYRMNEPEVCNDFASNARTAPWHDIAARYGVRSAAAFPLRVGGRPCGVIALYAKEIDYFDEELVALLREMADDVSYALDNFEGEKQRRLAVANLKESERRFRTLAEVSPDGIFQTDANGLGLFVNQRWCEYTGLTQAEAMGHGWEQAIHEEDRERTVNGWYAAAREHKPYESELRMQDRSGRVRWVVTHTAPACDEEGEPCGYVGTISDITARKSAELDLAFKNALLETQQENSLDGILVVDPKDHIASCNRRFVEMWGIPAAILETRSNAAAIEAVLDKLRDPESFLAKLRGICGRTDVRLQDEIELKDGRTFERYVASMLGADGHHYGTVYYFRDVTERKRAAAQARLSTTAFQSMADALMIIDRKKRVISVNRAFTKITGYEPQEVIGHTARIFQVNNQTREFYRSVRRTINRVGHWQGEVVEQRKNGEAFPSLLRVSAVRDASGKVVHYVGLFNDISQSKEYEARLEHLALHDALTHLPNRALFEARAAEALLRADRQKQKVTMLFIDLDHFKNVNDSLGHATGDLLLEAVADRLREAIRDTDTVARFGGDEFAILLEGLSDDNDTARVAEKVLAALAPRVAIAGHDLFISASIGIACYPRDGADVVTLLRNADAAMYRVKAEGRNAYLFFSSEMNERALERLVLTNTLRQALQRDEFVLHYQPRYDLKTGEVTGAEALIRWRHPERGLVPPDTFIPIAEESGLIGEIGEWVLRTACCQVRAWRDDGLPVSRMAVNLSARQFRDPHLVSRVSAALNECGLDADSLELEVTESMMMQDPEMTARTLEQLKAMGISISIDDFGTGYSSLSYLKRFPISYLKIDRSFTRGIPGDQDDVAIVSAVIAMAKSLNIAIIAEGVETEAQQTFLRNQGCQEAQGYLFSRPVPVEEFAGIVERATRKRALSVVAA